MTNIRFLAQRIRHTPGLERLDWLWDRMRGPYHRLIGFRTAGVAVKLGGVRSIRILPEFSGAYWETFEPEAVAAAVRWFEAHRTGMLLDVGCSFGIYSLLALSVSPQLEVLAFDSDASSLKAAGRMCARVAGRRLRLIQGFVGAAQSHDFDLETVCARTTELLSSDSIKDDVTACNFVTMRSSAASGIWTHSLDALLLNSGRLRPPVLLKCDVEGAELLVLRGARGLLQRYAPHLLLSVHPSVLAEYGCSVSDIRNALSAQSYRVEVIGIDHEEHWWCEPRG